MKGLKELLTKEQRKTAKENGISSPLLRYRMKARWDAERAITEPPREADISVKMRIEAEKNGISIKLLNYRIKAGWSDKRAVSTPPRDKAKDVENDPEMLALAKSNGISPQLFNSRIKQYGYTEYAAATMPKMGKDEKVALSSEARGGIPKEIVERAAKNGIGYPTLYNRLRVYESAWTEEEACTVQPLGYGERLKNHA